MSGCDPAAVGPTRREVVRAFGLGAFGIGTGAVTLGACASDDDTSSESSDESPGATTPNILMIIIDDANDYVGHLGGYGGTVETSRIDALAAQSAMFRYAYDPVPACAPSRATVMTGRSPGRTRVGEATGLGAVQANPLYADLVADPNHLVRHLRRHGYGAFGAGKVDHSYIDDVWDEFGPITEITELTGDNGAFGDDGTGYDYGILPDSDVHQDEKVADWTIEQLEADQDRPFLLVPGFYQPHTPWRVPAWTLEAYPIDEIVLPDPVENDYDDEIAFATQSARIQQFERVRDSGLWAEHIQYYLASLTHTDHQVGRVLDALAASGHADNTIVVLWSDNGFGLGEKMHFGKAALWEQSTRVPLTIKGLPGGSFSEPEVVDRPVSLVDLAPTITHLAGLPTPDSYDGASLHIDDGRPAHMWYERSQATRTGTIREIEWRNDAGDVVGHSRYDLSSDPEERQNLDAVAGPG